MGDFSQGNSSSENSSSGNFSQANFSQANFSPMMQQYFDIKAKYGKYLLFYRLGDFYEMFFEDAKIVSRELDLVLTGRDCGQEERAPMCGVPRHSCDAYIARLIAKGYKVAICEQMEDPSEAKGIVKRDVVRIITPGTLCEPGMLPEGKNNYLASVYYTQKRAGIVFCDVSTGALWATATDGGISAIMCEFSRFSPSEVICNPDMPPKLREAIENSCGFSCENGFDCDYEKDRLERRLLEYFGHICRDGEFETDAALCAALGYIDDVYKGSIKFGQKISRYDADRFMSIDLNAKRNLELEKTLKNGDRTGSLLGHLDRTQTPMGKRLLAEYLQRPLMDCALISKRQNAVAQLMEDDLLRESIADRLSGIHDIERIITRVVYGSANARELYSFALSLKRLPEIKKLTGGFTSSLLREANDCLDPLEDISSAIIETLEEELPLSVTEGGLIRAGCDPEADRLRNLYKNSNSALTEIEVKEKEKSGIKQLKVGYNRVFGYYIEVSKGNVDAVPDYFIRKQTLTNGERYITPELKELENEILQSKTKLAALEYEIFRGLREKVAAAQSRIRTSVSAIALLDVFISLATVAERHGYCRPQVDASDSVMITGGRHPVVENTVNGAFVPNDTVLDCAANRVLIITGPNMAGKSTYMRQNALIVIMAQMGSFVPAKSAKIGAADAVFTRVGASDDLSGGQSTFMVEMSELADILKNATNKSLIILDEIGRGTSTFDGMSIAGAVIEYIAASKTTGARTLFATHYHELCDMENKITGVKNYNILVKKRGDEIIFLRKIARGGADESYGIEVSKLAGVPEPVIKRAKSLLAQLEADRQNRVYSESEQRKQFDGGEQGALSDEKRKSILQKLQNTDAESITPLEALQTLADLSKAAREL